MNNFFKKNDVRKVFFLGVCFFIACIFFQSTQLYAANPTQNEQQFKPLAPIIYDGVNYTPTGTGIAASTTGILKLIIGLAAVLAVILIVVGGFQYATTDAVFSKKEGKRRIVQTLFGLAIIIGSYIILNTINPRLLSFGFLNQLPTAPESSSSTTATPSEHAGQYYLLVSNVVTGVTNADYAPTERECADGKTRYWLGENPEQDNPSDAFYMQVKNNVTQQIESQFAPSVDTCEKLVKNFTGEQSYTNLDSNGGSVVNGANLNAWYLKISDVTQQIPDTSESFYDKTSCDGARNYYTGKNAGSYAKADAWAFAVYNSDGSFLKYDYKPTQAECSGGIDYWKRNGYIVDKPGPNKFTGCFPHYTTHGQCLLQYTVVKNCSNTYKISSCQKSS